MRISGCSPAAGHSYRGGVIPTIGQLAKMRNCGASPDSSELMAFGGGVDGIGVTSGTPRVYLVFWGSQWGTQGVDLTGNLTFSNDVDSGAPYIQKLMQGLGTGAESWSATMTQYCDGPLVAVGATSCPPGAPHVGYPTGGALAGVWYDNSALEPAAATYSDLAGEAISAAAHFGNSTAASNRYVQYVVLSAPGLDPDNYRTGAFCAWHSAMSSAAGDVAFTNMPYLMDVGATCGAGFVNSPGTDDGYSIVEGHEYAETLTDQNPTGGWTDSNGVTGETGDKCAWIRSGQGAAANVAMTDGPFAMQSTFSNDGDQCDIAYSSSPISTTTTLNASTNPVVVPHSVGFTTTVSPTPDSGTVAFTQDGNPISGCSAVLVSSGQASCTAAYPHTGTFSIQATYSGHGNYQASTSNVVAEAVNPATTSTVLTASRNPAPVSATVSYAVTVSPVPNGGTVAVRQSGVTLPGCSAIPLSDGQGSCTTTYRSVGTYPVQARYSGNTDYLGSSSNTMSEHVAVADGYWMVDSTGSVYRFGAANSYGNAQTSSVTHFEPTPDGHGYWIVNAAGQIYAFGDAPALGNAGTLTAGETVSSLSSTPSGRGYWLFTTRGRVLRFGDAAFFGDMSGQTLNGPVIGSIATPSGHGYYMVASDGGIFAFGDARFHGSMGGAHLNKPVNGLVPTADNGGYWLVASDGGIFAFGDAAFHGSMGGRHLNKPVVGMVRYGNGYLMVGSDGGIFDFSNQPFLGSLAGSTLPTRIVSVAT